ncbi:MAG: hypothetical protein VB142_11425 [Burkholderia sp.]
MAYLLIERYIRRQGAYNNKRKTYDWKPGLLDSDSMMVGARALRAAFFQHFLDREVYRPCSPSTTGTPPSYGI